MKQNIKKYSWLPDSIRGALSAARNNFRKFRQRSVLKRALLNNQNKKIIVGAATTDFEGWAPTNRDFLDLLLENDWLACFGSSYLDAILAEHVWEHLSQDEAIVAAENCFKFLKSGGYIRLAVPDGFHTDRGYIARVRPGGSGPGSDDHKVLYTYETFSQIFCSVGFEVTLLEYFDEHGKFHAIKWDSVDGKISRSTRFDPRNRDNPTAYTSLIIDARKP